MKRKNIPQHRRWKQQVTQPAHNRTVLSADDNLTLENPVMFTETRPNPGEMVVITQRYARNLGVPQKFIDQAQKTPNGNLPITRRDLTLIEAWSDKQRTQAQTWR